MSTPQQWVPLTEQDRHRVRDELDGVLASSQFCNSKRYPAMLRYVVERTLAGEGGALKERTLGIDVFHRPPDYDTNTDTIVRFTAGEVRKRLAVYYHGHPDATLQITLPAGSYVAEFFQFEDLAGKQNDMIATATGRAASAKVLNTPSTEYSEQPERANSPEGEHKSTRNGLLAVCAIALLSFLVVFFLGRGVAKERWPMWGARNSLDSFWSPVLHDHGQALLCVGAGTFAEKSSSDPPVADNPPVADDPPVADKNTQYPFAFMQTISGVSQISGLLGHDGAKFEVQAAAVTQLPDLREHPVILLGAYNNEWTLRLTRPLRFHFADKPTYMIVDAEHPGTTWQRNLGQPYASADDYALIARFHDSLTGSVVVVAAGLGRNGTESAAQFLTSERYMGLLKQKVGYRLEKADIEVVLHSRVVNGKTGAPEIEQVYIW